MDVPLYSRESDLYDTCRHLGPDALSIRPTGLRQSRTPCMSRAAKRRARALFGGGARGVRESLAALGRGQAGCRGPDGQRRRSQSRRRKCRRGKRWSPRPHRGALRDRRSGFLIVGFRSRRSGSRRPLGCAVLAARCCSGRRPGCEPWMGRWLVRGNGQRPIRCRDGRLPLREWRRWWGSSGCRIWGNLGQRGDGRTLGHGCGGRS